MSVAKGCLGAFRRGEREAYDYVFYIYSFSQSKLKACSAAVHAAFIVDCVNSKTPTSRTPRRLSSTRNR